MISKVPCNDDYSLNKVLNLCERYGIYEEKASHCKSRGMEWRKYNSFNNALEWFLRAGDLEIVSKLRNHMIEKVLKNGDLNELDALVNNHEEEAFTLNYSYDFIPLYIQFNFLIKDIQALKVN